MRTAVLSIFFATCLAWTGVSPAFAEAAEISSVLRGFDSATWRFQLADILGTLLAIRREGAGECGFTIDDAAVEELSTWLEHPSAQVAETSAFVTRRDQVEGIMTALLKLAPSTVCDAAQDKLPASLKAILRK
jgi:hypothetical protein